MILTVLFILALPVAFGCWAGVLYFGMAETGPDFTVPALALLWVLAVGYFIGFILLGLFGAFDPVWPQLRLAWQ